MILYIILSSQSNIRGLKELRENHELLSSWLMREKLEFEQYILESTMFFNIKTRETHTSVKTSSNANRTNINMITFTKEKVSLETKLQSCR